MAFDPRPSSPGQLGVFGLALIVVAWFGIAGPLTPIVFNLALVLLLVAGLGWFAQPRSRTSYWRGQRIDMSETLRWWERLYYIVYRG